MLTTPTLLDFLAEYETENAITPATREQYAIAIRLFGKHLGRNARVNDLSDAAVNRWLVEYGESVKPATARGKRQTMLVLWRAAYLSGYCLDRPGRVRQIKASDTPRDVWRKDEVERLVRSCMSIHGTIPTTDIPTHLYLASLLSAAWDTGLRAGDLLVIRRDHLTEPGWFGVTQHKTGRIQWCKFSNTTKQLAVATFEHDPHRDLVWPTWAPCGGETMKARMRKIRELAFRVMRAAELDASDGPFKKLRRSSITEAERLVVGNGRLQAGHTDQKTTERWYLSRTANHNRPVPSGLNI